MGIVPPYAECDYTNQKTSGNCAAHARGAVGVAVNAPWTSGLKLFRRLRSECSALSETLESEDGETSSRITLCRAKKATALTLSREASRDQREIEKAWNAFVTKYNRDYEEKIGTYKTFETTVREVNEHDRKQEWAAVQQIKCMLEHYKTGGGFNDAALQQCKSKIVTKGIVDIGYPAIIKQLEHKLAPFEAQADTSSHDSTCNQRQKAPEFVCPPKKPRAKPQCTPAAGPPPPTKSPTNTPTKSPTMNPTPPPTKHPTNYPTRHPTRRPTRPPSPPAWCRPSSSRKDAGYADRYRGWYDASGCGRCYDYCRWVGNWRNPNRNPAWRTKIGNAYHGGSGSWWSCRRAGTSSSYSPVGQYGSRFRHRKCSYEGAIPPKYGR